MAHGQWTEVEARGVLDAWRKSGQPLEHFAGSGLVPQRLHWWKKKLASKGKPVVLPVRVVDVDVGDYDLDAVGPAPQQRPLRDGLRVRLHGSAGALASAGGWRQYRLQPAVPDAFGLRGVYQPIHPEERGALRLRPRRRSPAGPRPPPVSGPGRRQSPSVARRPPDANHAQRGIE